MVLTGRVVFAKRPIDPEDEEVPRNQTRHGEAGLSNLNRAVHKEVERSDQPNTTPSGYPKRIGRSTSGKGARLVRTARKEREVRTQKGDPKGRS